MTTFVGRFFLFCGVVFANVFAFSVAHATSTDGYHKVMVVPAVVSSSTYNSSIFIHNPSATTDVNVQLTFYQGEPYSGSDPVGPTQTFNCGTKNVPAGRVVSFANLQAACPAAPPVGPTSVFGWLAANEVTNATTKTFTIFTRVDDNSRTNGFEIEGFPSHTFTGADAYVIGAARTNGGNSIKTNCFVSALAEPTTVTLSITDGGTGGSLFGPTTINLPANRMVRLLNVGNADYANGIFKVVTTPTGSSPQRFPGVIAFCTVENNVSRDDDFRIAKASPVADAQTFRQWLENANELNAIFTTGAAGSDRNVHIAYFKHPDVVECALGGPKAANLEIILVDPEGNVRARNRGDLGFTNLYTGDKGQHGQPGVALGLNAKWFVEVQSFQGDPSGANAQYAILCRAGSGFGGHEWVGRNIAPRP